MENPGQRQHAVVLDVEGISLSSTWVRDLRNSEPVEDKIQAIRLCPFCFPSSFLCLFFAYSLLSVVRRLSKCKPSQDSRRLTGTNVSSSASFAFTSCGPCGSSLTSTPSVSTANEVCSFFSLLSRLPSLFCVVFIGSAAVRVVFLCAPPRRRPLY